MLKQWQSVRWKLNLQFYNQCCISIKPYYGYTLIQNYSFSEWKYEKGSEYFPSTKSKSGPQVILDPNKEIFESPYSKIKKQKNPSFSYKASSEKQEEPDILSSLQPLSSINSDDDNEDEEEYKNAMIEKKQREEYELMKWKEWKTKQIKTKEYIPRSDFYTPRTLEDFKNWNIKQDEMSKYKEKLHSNIKEEEELRSFDLFRGGHIMQALKVPDINRSCSLNSDLTIQDNDSNTLSLSETHKFDFSGEATYIIEGMKYFEYYVQKYGYYFTSGFLKISILSSISLYLLLYQNYITQSEIIDILQAIRPFNASTIEIAKANTLYDVWWNTLFGSYMIPMMITAGIYAKCKGEWWEYKELRKNPKEHINLKTDVLTLENKKSISSNKIIYEIALIKERRKERMDSLAPLHDVVDITETFSPHRKRGVVSGGGIPFSPKKIIEKGMKLNKFMKRHGIANGLTLWASTSYSAMDPRRAGSTQNFGLLKLQTRLDEFGRVIPGWQRQSTQLWIIPTIAIFLFFPSFGDWFLGWTA